MTESLAFLVSDVTFQVNNFLLLGGDVLLLIAAAIFVMWGFIVERALFFYTRYPAKARRIQALWDCLLYTSPSPRDRQKSRMPSSA